MYASTRRAEGQYTIGRRFRKRSARARPYAFDGRRCSILEWLTRWWLDAAMGVVAGLLAFGYHWLRRKTMSTITEHDALKAGIKALLHDRIVDSYNVYKERGYWPIYARETMTDLLAQYHALGGNGVINDLMDALRELPTEGDGAKEIIGRV